jgi:SAM-dependent methyltransferase
MLFTQFIVEHYEIFKEEIIKSVYPIDFSEMALNRLGLKTAPQEVIENQIIKEQVNYWFYKILKGDLKLVESIIVKKSLGPKMQAKMEELNKAVQGFVLGEVSEAMSFKNNQFDEIKMISGYGIPLFKKEALTREVARILKPGGFMIITGNRAVLKSNGIRIIKTYDGSSCTFPPFVNDLFEVVDWDQEVDAKKLGSEHTLGGEFDPQEEFHTVYFKKIPGAIMS